jgi:vesicle transport protein SEC22
MSVLAQTLFKKMAVEKPSNSRMSVDSGYFVFHYMIDADVCYLTLTEKSYPKKLAYQYLEELQSEFVNLYGSQIQAVSRPYAFIKFGKRPNLQSVP